MAKLSVGHMRYRSLAKWGTSDVLEYVITARVSRAPAFARYRRVVSGARGQSWCARLSASRTVTAFDRRGVVPWHERVWSGGRVAFTRFGQHRPWQSTRDVSQSIASRCNTRFLTQAGMSEEGGDGTQVGKASWHKRLQRPRRLARCFS